MPPVIYAHSKYRSVLHNHISMLLWVSLAAMLSFRESVSSDSRKGVHTTLFLKTLPCDSRQQSPVLGRMREDACPHTTSGLIVILKDKLDRTSFLDFFFFFGFLVFVFLQANFFHFFWNCWGKSILCLFFTVG